MTEPLLPLSDEDLSAYPDDEVTAALRARIEDDPQAQQRVRVLSAARDAVAAAPPTPLPPDVVDAMIARAIESLDAPADPPLAPPTSIRRGRRGGSAQSTTWMVAAAVVALVAIGLGMVWSGVQSTETSDTAGNADAAASEAERQAARQESDAEGGTADAAFEERPPASVEPAQLVDLGSSSTGAELRRSLVDGFPVDDQDTTSDQVEADPPGDSEPITVGQVDSCTQQIGVRHGSDAEVVDVGVATVSGERYLVYDLALAEAHDAGDHLVAVVRVDHGCSPFITFYR